MTIVRELVTRLAFQVDQSGVNKANQTISGFKGGLEGIVSQAFNFGDLVTKFFGDIATESLVFQDIADLAGVSTKEVRGLVAAAGQFNIKPEQFQNALVTINDLSRQAAFGFGALNKIAIETGANFKDINGNALTGVDAFNEFFKVLSKIENVQFRAQLATQVFGREIGPKLARAAGQGGDSLTKLLPEFQELAELQEENAKVSREFDANLNSLGTQFSRLSQLATKNLLPAINSIAGFIAKGLSHIKPNYFTDSNGRVISEQDYNALQGTKSSPSVSLTLNNKFQFDVPPGTTQEQATEMQEALKLTMESYIDSKAREIINNYQQVE